VLGVFGCGWFWVVKPFNPDQLLAVIKKVIR